VPESCDEGSYAEGGLVSEDAHSSGMVGDLLILASHGQIPFAVDE
jgi:hypothetical protein